MILIVVDLSVTRGRTKFMLNPYHARYRQKNVGLFYFRFEDLQRGPGLGPSQCHKRLKRNVNLVWTSLGDHIEKCGDCGIDLLIRVDTRSREDMFMSATYHGTVTTFYSSTFLLHANPIKVVRRDWNVGEIPAIFSALFHLGGSPKEIIACCPKERHNGGNKHSTEVG